MLIIAAGEKQVRCLTMVVKAGKKGHAKLTGQLQASLAKSCHADAEVVAVKTRMTEEAAQSAADNKVGPLSTACACKMKPTSRWGHSRCTSTLWHYVVCTYCCACTMQTHFKGAGLLGYRQVVFCTDGQRKQPCCSHPQPCVLTGWTQLVKGAHSHDNKTQRTRIQVVCTYFAQQRPPAPSWHID